MHSQTQIDAIMNDAAWNGGDYAQCPARVAEAEFGTPLLSTDAGRFRKSSGSFDAVAAAPASAGARRGKAGGAHVRRVSG
jgi:hypothetical protein